MYLVPASKNLHKLCNANLIWLRRHSTSKSSLPIICIPPKSKIYAFGTPSATARPLIHNVAWNLEEGDAWAIISGTGGSGKGVIFKTLLGYARLQPPTPEIQGQWAESGGLYPFLSTKATDPYTRVSYVSFRQRTGGDSGSFFDYTARYGAMREEEDRVTLRETLCTASGVSSRRDLFEALTVQMGLTELLDIPMITLSNGQTRRARIVKAILDEPELLLLDEPLTGLDLASRKALNATLEQLHRDRSPRIVIGLRKGEEIPKWITHVLEIEDGAAIARKILPTDHKPHSSATSVASVPVKQPSAPVQLGSSKDLLVELKGVNVAYGSRKVLTNINWEIRKGERWHLRGANGSGKTTLLALLTGDHPQSYVQQHLFLPSLTSLSSLSTPAYSNTNSNSISQSSLLPRKKIPTAHLRKLIGVVSPEMFDAFPRRHPGMSVWEAVTTGFDGGYVPLTRGASAAVQDEGGKRNGRGGVGWVDVGDEDVPVEKGTEVEEAREEVRKWRVQRCWEVLEALGPAAWTVPSPSPSSQNPGECKETTRAFASASFTSLTPGEQRIVLLMRALVGRPPLVLLDEAWSGMDAQMIEAARRYLRGDGVDERQAVVVITHWEEEVPWCGDEVRRFVLG